MLAEVLILLAAVGGSASMVGVIGWLWYRTKRLEDASPGLRGGRQDLLQQLEVLRDELEETRNRTEGLRERLDFVERLLESGSSTVDEESRGGGGRGSS